MNKLQRKFFKAMDLQEKIVEAARETLGRKSQLTCKHDGKEHPEIISTPETITVDGEFLRVKYVFYPNGKNIKNGVLVEGYFVGKDLFNDFEISFATKGPLACIVNVEKR